MNMLAYSAGILVVFLGLRFGFPRQQNLWFLLLLAASAAASVHFEARGCRHFLLTCRKVLRASLSNPASSGW
jgi:hypothetical protein